MRSSPIALGKLSASQEKAAANCGNPNQDPRRDLPELQTAKEQQCERKALWGINRTRPYRLIKGSQKYAHYCCVRSVSGYFADRTHGFQHWLCSLFCYSSPPCRSSFWQRNPRHPNRKPKTDDRQPTTACRRHAPLTLLYTLTVSTGLLSAKSPPTSTPPPHSKHLCTPQKFPRRSYAGSVLER